MGPETGEELCNDSRGEDMKYKVVVTVNLASLDYVGPDMTVARNLNYTDALDKANQLSKQDARLEIHVETDGPQRKVVENQTLGNF